MKLLLCLACLVAGEDDPPDRSRDEGSARPAPVARRRVLPLSTREAVALSLNHNLDIEVARYQPWIEDQNVYAALGTWDHVAYARVQGGERISQPSNVLIDSTRPESDSADFSVGIRKTLPFGATYDLSVNSGRILTNNPFAPFNPRWTQSAGVEAVIPLLRGGSTAANTATLIIARHSRDESVDLFEKTLTDSVFGTTQAYWDLVFAIENKKVKERSLEVASRLLDDNRAKLEQRLVTRLEVTQAEAGVAAQQEGILTAEAEIQNAMDRLKRLVDPALLQQEIAIAPVEAPRGAESELDERAAVQKSLEEALARRPELRQVQKQMLSQDVIIVRAENDLLPRFDLTGRAFVFGTDDEFGGGVHEASKSDFRELLVGFIFEYPLESSTARGSLNRAQLEKRRLHLQTRNLENQILVEVREAVRAVKTNEKRIEATRRARILAQDQFDGELARRAEGLSTTFRVLDVQEDLVLARTNELKALIDYNLSWHKLHQTTGTLLDRNGILLKENLQPRVTVAMRP